MTPDTYGRMPEPTNNRYIFEVFANVSGKIKSTGNVAVWADSIALARRVLSECHDTPIADAVWLATSDINGNFGGIR